MALQIHCESFTKIQNLQTLAPRKVEILILDIKDSHLALCCWVFNSIVISSMSSLNSFWVHRPYNYIIDIEDPSSFKISIVDYSILNL